MVFRNLQADWYVLYVVPIATDVCASLRGRPLKGLELQLPSGYAGVFPST